MKIYNLMSAGGFNGMGFNFFMAWIGLAMLVLIGALAKKWLGEEEILGYPYNWVGSLIGAVIYIIIVTFTGSAKISLVAGLVGMLVGGFGFGTFYGGTE